MEQNNEEYNEKAYNIFNLLNQFRANPRQLARHLEKLKKYLDKETNVLSEPDKVQIQMIEGEKVIDEAIKFLKSLMPIPPLEWDDYLSKSAQDHVNDIGPKGILSYESSDGTEPEARITKYGSYIDSLGENIDFGPNDEIGVIVSMTLDDGEVERPHRENLFKSEFKKVGIACGPHKTEFQLVVMDFASEFFPKKMENNNNNNKINNYIGQKPSISNLIDVTENPIHYNMNIKSSIKESNNIINNYNNNNNVNNNSNNTVNNNNNNNFNNNNNNNVNNNILDETKKQILEKMSNNILNKNGVFEIEQLKQQVKAINSSKKVVQKKIEIFTTITYRFEDGSQRTVNEVKTHIINGNKE